MSSASRSIVICVFLCLFSASAQSQAQAQAQAQTPLRDGTPEAPLRFGMSPSTLSRLNESSITSYFISRGIHVQLIPTLNPVPDLVNHLIELIDIDASLGYLTMKKYGADVLVAEETEEGKPYYEAAIWVKSDGGINNVADLKGKRSCHTGYLKSAGMFMPIGYLLRQANSGLSHTSKAVEPAIDSSEASLLKLITNHFSSVCAAPTRAGETGVCTGCDKKTGCDASDKYADYFGALRGLMDGVCDVAFARSSTWNDMCAPSPHNDTCINCNSQGCIPSSTLHSCACHIKGEFRVLTHVGRVPSHPIIYLPSRLSRVSIQVLISAFIGASQQLFCPLQGPCQDKRYLPITTHTTSQTRAQVHFADLGANIDVVPGLSTYICKACTETTSTNHAITQYYYIHPLIICGGVGIFFSIIPM